MPPDDGGDDGIDVEPTDRVDFAKVFTVRVGTSVRAGGNDIVRFGERLGGDTPAIRREKLIGIIERIDDVIASLEDAKVLLREQAHLGLGVVKPYVE